MARIGKAYAFFNYDGSVAELYSLMAWGAKAANFTGLSFHSLFETEKRMLHPELIKSAREKQVRGSVLSGCNQTLFHKLTTLEPVPAIELHRTVMCREEGATNLSVAGKLNCVLGYVAGIKYKYDVFRGTTVYRDAKKCFRWY